MQEYSFKFTKLSRYAPYMMSNPRDEMSYFVTRVFDDLVEEWSSSMLHDNMDISRLMVHAQEVELTRIKRKNKEFKRSKAYKGGTSKDKLEIQDKPRFTKRVTN